LQFIHSRNFIHCDLKPSNLVLGAGKHADVVHLIDFGLSKEFRDPNTHKHIPFKKDVGFTGTPTFASINSHLGSELGRRDDLESLAYTLFFFLWGFLPWQHRGVEKQAVLESKQELTTLGIFRALPLELRQFFEHCRSLPFDGKPLYDHFYELFTNLLVKDGFQDDMTFDWDVADNEIPGQDLKNRSAVASQASRKHHMT
jgi:serine/threonine protein kinase